MSSVGGKQLLDDLHRYIRRFVVVSDSQAATLTLWVLHSHAIDAADATPYLAVTSPEKRSGKSRLLEVLQLVVAKPWMTARTSVAALVRKVSGDRCTLLLDESDAAFSGPKDYSEALRGILNAGHRRGGLATLCGPKNKNFDVVDYDVFGAKLIAGIGTLPDTVADRSIQIRLQRKRAGECAERFRERAVKPDATELRNRCADWAAENNDKLRNAQPSLPDELNDRAQDGWEPLLAIADEVGGEWPERARKAAVALSGMIAVEDDSLGVLLLRDVRVVFEELATARLGTEELLSALYALAESPWATWHQGKPMTPRALAQSLRAFDVRSHQLWIGGGNKHGYAQADFKNAFERYLPENERLSTSDARTIANKGESPGSFTLGTQNLVASETNSSAGNCDSIVNKTNAGPHGIRALARLADGTSFSNTPDSVEAREGAKLDLFGPRPVARAATQERETQAETESEEAAPWGTI